MVGRLGALAVVARDPAGGERSGEHLAREQEVDPQPHAAVEVSLAVVPPRVLHLVGVQVTVGVDEAAGGEDRVDAGT